MPNKPPLPEGRMNLVAEEHCFVDLILDHPIFGELEIDTMQRQIRECELIAQTGIIVYKSMDLRVVRHRVTKREDYPLLHGKAYYVFVVADPQRSNDAPGHLSATSGG